MQQSVGGEDGQVGCSKHHLRGRAVRRQGLSRLLAVHLGDKKEKHVGTPSPLCVNSRNGTELMRTRCLLRLPRKGGYLENMMSKMYVNTSLGVLSYFITLYNYMFDYCSNNPIQKYLPSRATAAFLCLVFTYIQK